MLSFTADLLEARELRAVAAQLVETRHLADDPEFAAAAAKRFVETLPRAVLDALRAKGAVSARGSVLKRVPWSASDAAGLDSATLVGLAEHGLIEEEGGG